MKDEYLQVIRAAMLQPDFEIVETLTSLSDNQIEQSLLGGGAGTTFSIYAVRWAGAKLADALAALTVAYPSADTPVKRTNPRDASRVDGIAHGHEQWLDFLFDNAREDELRSLTLALAMAVKHFNEG